VIRIISVDKYSLFSKFLHGIGAIGAEIDHHSDYKLISVDRVCMRAR